MESSGKGGVFPLLKELGMDRGDVMRKATAMVCECTSRLKRKEDAIKQCTEALKLDENNVDVLCNRADAYMLMEEYEEGTKELSGSELLTR